MPCLIDDNKPLPVATRPVAYKTDHAFRVLISITVYMVVIVDNY